LKDGGFYGWPYSYIGDNVDPRVKPQRQDLVARAIVPDVLLGAHVAPLQFAFYTGKQFRKVIEVARLLRTTVPGTGQNVRDTRLRLWPSRMENRRPIHAVMTGSYLNPVGPTLTDGLLAWPSRGTVHSLFQMTERA